VAERLEKGVKMLGVRRGRGWKESPGSPNADAEERICGSLTEGSRRTGC
jgi:hypothetical protein